MMDDDEADDDGRPARNRAGETCWPIANRSAG